MNERLSDYLARLLPEYTDEKGDVNNAKLAVALGVQSAAVYLWKTKNKLPAKKAIQLNLLHPERVKLDEIKKFIAV
jgi:hypothetical protein